MMEDLPGTGHRIGIPAVDRRLIEVTAPALGRPVPAALAGARDDVLAAARDLLAIPGSSLTRPWPWNGDSVEEARYGAYRAAEGLELAEVEARAAMAMLDASDTRAARLIGPATAARWDLQGLLLELDDDILDADPGSGEWSIRRVLGHTIGSQLGYAWGTSWWQAPALLVDDPDPSRRLPDEMTEGFGDENGSEADGSFAELRARLDAILDLSAERLAGLPDERTAAGARWGGSPVTVGFGFGRWSSHMREHTIQVEKTLVMLGHEPGEPARLARVLLAAYGRAEAAVFGRQAADDAAQRIGRGAAEARAAAASARASAGA